MSHAVARVTVRVSSTPTLRRPSLSCLCSSLMARRHYCLWSWAQASRAAVFSAFCPTLIRDSISDKCHPCFLARARALFAERNLTLPGDRKRCRCASRSTFHECAATNSGAREPSIVRSRRRTRAVNTGSDPHPRRPTSSHLRERFLVRSAEVDLGDVGP